MFDVYTGDHASLTTLQHLPFFCIILPLCAFSVTCPQSFICLKSQFNKPTCVERARPLSMKPRTHPVITASTESVSNPFRLMQSFTYFLTLTENMLAMQSFILSSGVLAGPAGEKKVAGSGGASSTSAGIRSSSMARRCE